MDKATYKPTDNAFVDLRTLEQRSYWAGLLGCTEARLLDAVSLVGPQVGPVKMFLNMCTGYSPKGLMNAARAATGQSE